jgi:hypothetical protein
MTMKAAALLDLLNDCLSFFMQTTHRPRSNAWRLSASGPVWAPIVSFG